MSHAVLQAQRNLVVNPLPKGARLCNFDCVYCGYSGSVWPRNWDLQPQFPEPEAIRRALALAACEPGGEELDSITIAGNGEPTLSPYLDEIVDVVVEARDRDWPQARTAILTNGTNCHRRAVRSAVAKLDQRVVKLDAGNNWILDQLNRPAGKLSIIELVRRISMMPEIIVRSMFVHGPVDNTRPEHIRAWAERLMRLEPLALQIRTLDRAPARSWVRPAPLAELEEIARYVESTAGIPVHVLNGDEGVAAPQLVAAGFMPVFKRHGENSSGGA